MKLRAFVSAATIFAIGALGTGVASAEPTQIEHFVIVSTSTSFEDPAVIVAAGPISGTGTDETVNGGTDRFVFPDGTVTVKHHATTSSETSDEANCVFTFSERGTYTITRGTGAYRHASGSGRYKSFGFVQGCDEEEPTAAVFIVTGKGPLSLG